MATGDGPTNITLNIVPPPTVGETATQIGTSAPAATAGTTVNLDLNETAETNSVQEPEVTEVQLTMDTT